MTLHHFSEYGFLVSFIVGSVGFVGNGIGESRHGFGLPILGWMQKVGLFASWAFIVLYALTK